jgi:hypothetical protein
MGRMLQSGHAKALSRGVIPSPRGVKSQARGGRREAGTQFADSLRLLRAARNLIS